MFHLTPQERTALIAFIAICLVGSFVRFSLDKDVRPMRWVKTSSQKIRYRPPDINYDDAARIEKIDGIGPKTAQRIVEYRAIHGPYASLDELRKVKGINKRNWQKINDFYLEAGHDQ